LGEKKKSITVSNCPLRVQFEPWLDQGELSRDPQLSGATFTEQNATHSDYLSFSPMKSQPKPQSLFLSNDLSKIQSFVPFFIPFIFSLHAEKPNIIFVLADDLGLG
jgi:hypothetical protein